jgi:UDP-glucose 4-epimerase
MADHGSTPRRVFVTGGAGFIGSNLVDRLLARGDQVTAYDNLSTGQRVFLEEASANPNLRLVEADLLDAATLREAVAGHDLVVHLAANADVRFGTDHPGRDLEQNVVATHNVLEAMRLGGVRQIAFSSTGSIYGEPTVFPTPEDAPFPIQTSLYGASKLAAEGLIEAYCEGFGFQGFIFRFVSVLGERYTHGHVFDFYKKLLADPTRLHVLGDGRQRKSYMYVQDCIDAMLLAFDTVTDKVSIHNIGTDEYTEVNQSIGWITEYLGVKPTLEYAGGERGWIGDSPFIFLDASKIRALGWQPKLTIREAVIKTVQYLQGQPWSMEWR